MVLHVMDANTKQLVPLELIETSAGVYAIATASAAASARAVEIDPISGEKTATFTVLAGAAKIEFTVLSGTWTCNGNTYTSDNLEHHVLEVASATLPAVTITASGSSPRLALEVWRYDA